MPHEKSKFFYNNNDDSDLLSDANSEENLAYLNYFPLQNSIKKDELSIPSF